MPLCFHFISSTLPLLKARFDFDSHPPFQRGERVLHDERFVGLKLPHDFVRPSERIRQRALGSARSSASSSTTPRTPASTVVRI